MLLLRPVPHDINPDARFRSIGPSWSPWHHGVDWLCPKGTAVQGSPGRVSRIYTTTYGGLTLEIALAGGYSVNYVHLAETRASVGQQVADGQIVALSGNSGKNTTGAHLHCTLRDPGGTPIDPEPWLDPEGVVQLGNRRVVLDPAGGGRETGLLTPSGIAASRLNLMLAQDVRRMLEGAGVEAVMTLDADRDMSAAQRVAAVNAASSDCVVSIACAGSPDAKDRGIETFALPGGSAQRLAEGILYEVGLATRAPARGLTTRLRPAILTQTKPPAVIVSPGHVTNPLDGAFLAEPTYRYRVALAVSVGILAWLAAEKG
ncbi:MAG: hypothetical protein C4551_06650 [Bacillota bacterium]|nr:MAG: hypothetical protein C4551_06650 [Bacillota bacterium]